TTLIKGNYSHLEKYPKNYWWEKESHSNWYVPNKEWIETDNDLPDARNLVSVTDTTGEEWFILESFPEWDEPRKLGEDRRGTSRKLMWYMVRSYLVPKKYYKKLTEWALKHDFMGRWMPENSDRYEV